MSKDYMRMLMAIHELERAKVIIDAQKVPQHGRVVWPPDSMQLPRVTWAPSPAFHAMVADRRLIEEQEAVTSAVADAFAVGLGAYQIDHLDGDISTQIWGCPFRIAGPIRLRPLVAAIRSIWP